MTPFFQISGVSIQFGGIRALDDVSFEVSEKEIVGLIGPNGAGKTTILNCICRYYAPSNGRIRFGNTDLLRRRSHQLAKLGITRTFQQLELFPSMSALDNLLIAQHSAVRSGLVAQAFRMPWANAEQRRMRARARELLRFLELGEYEEWPVGALSYGLRKRLDLGRAIALSPKLVLMDEPAAGLTPRETERLVELIRKIRQESETSVLLVEHHMPVVMGVCDRVVVLNFGRKLAEGTPAEIQKNAQVLEAYLGKARVVKPEVKAATARAGTA